MPAQKLLYQICWWKNKTKTDFVLFILLEINFTKLKWVTCKTCKFHWYVSLFCIALQQTRLKWWSYFYITLDVCTITWLSFCKEPARQVISLFVICWSLLTSPASKHFFFYVWSATPVPISKFWKFFLCWFLQQTQKCLKLRKLMTIYILHSNSYDHINTF